MGVSLFLAAGLLLAQTGVGSDSPEDRFANHRTRDQWLADVAQVRALGADEIWVILDNWRGDGRNTTPWIGADPANGVDHAFLAERAAWIAEANRLGVRVEVALFEEETYPLAPQARRLELARAAAQAFAGLDCLICLSEELPARLAGPDVEALVAAINDQDPAARVTIHNPIWGNDAATVLAPLAEAARAGRIHLWGVSGQVPHPRDTGAFLRRWRSEFPPGVSVRVVEVGPAAIGISPWPSVEQRGYFWTSAMAGESVRIYKGLAADVGLADLTPWAAAYTQAGVAQRHGNRPGFAWDPQRTDADGSASSLVREGGLVEIRVWWPDGDGTVELPAGRWLLERRSTLTGSTTAPPEWIEHAGGPLRLDRPSGQPNTDGWVVLRTPARAREAVRAFLLGREPDAPDLNGDGRIDAADAGGYSAAWFPNAPRPSAQ